MASFGGDSWLTEHEACLGSGQAIMEKINQRDELQRSGSNYSKINADIRLSLRRFSQDIQHLRQQLTKASSQYHITQREAERRQGLLDNLLAKDKILNEAFKKDITYTAPERASLLNSNTAGFGQDTWGMESEETKGMSIDDIRQQQQLVIQDQDKNLDVLASVVARQKQMGETIGDELEQHNEIIDDLTRNVHRTDDRIHRETKHIRKVGEKAKDWAFYVIIIVLLIAIVVIVAVPAP
ncbi:syntaxin-8-like [Amphiura filiformis]|uniref:syntaxin-8-like n=1 Tax=Amphiura filiformis TaxID=82378 RepID=UPI003B226E0F